MHHSPTSLVLTTPSPHSNTRTMSGPVVDVFRVLAASTSMMMILSPIPTVYRIHKTHDTGHMSIFPLISVLANCHTWMMSGYMDENVFPVFTTFAIGDVISLVYVVVFYRWTTERSKAHKLIAAYTTALVAATTYVVLGGYGYTGQTRHEVANIAGCFAVVTALILYSSPLEKVINVFKHKSAVFIPIHMVIAGTSNNVAWVIYTSLTSKWILFAPNFAMMLVGIFQIIVYFFVYNPKTHPLADDWKERRSTDDEEELTPMPSDSGDLESPSFIAVQSPLPPHTGTRNHRLLAPPESASYASIQKLQQP